MYTGEYNSNNKLMLYNFNTSFKYNKYKTKNDKVNTS